MTCLRLPCKFIKEATIKLICPGLLLSHCVTTALKIRFSGEKPRDEKQHKGVEGREAKKTGGWLKGNDWSSENEREEGKREHSKYKQVNNENQSME